jgi:plastocyanin domain-containing protein
MAIDKILAAIGGVVSIFFVYWFFFMKKQNIVEASGSIDILVDGGYKPDVMSIPYGQTTKLIFERKDSSSCLEEVVLSDFKVRKFLPLNQKTEIEITPDKKGTFDFSCGMGMFHGKLIVE